MKFSFACAALASFLAAGFSFGSPTPAPFSVSIVAVTPSPAVVGTAVTFTASAIGGSGGVSYQWDFGDGTVTAYDPATATITHTYTDAAHVTVRVNAEDVLANTSFGTQTLTVHHPLPSVKPTNSSTILFDAANGRVWCVNPDQDSVTAITTAGVFVFEIPVG
jgi:hypothetical protein